MSSLENANNKLADSIESGKTLLLLDTKLTDPERSAVFQAMSTPETLRDHWLLHTRLQQDEETPRDRIVRELVNDLKDVSEFKAGNSATAWVKAGLKHQLLSGGVPMADSLAEDISKKLPKGMQLQISRDPKLVASVEQIAKEKGEPVPDYVRFVELLKDGRSLGKVGMALRSSVQELAMQLGETKQLLPGSPEANSIVGESQKLYARGGARSADSLAPEINKTLPDGMKLTISDDPDYRKKVVEESNKEGTPIPDYIRLIELKDKDGRSLGKMGVGHYKEKPKAKPRMIFT